MSKKYTESLTVVSGNSFGGWDNSDFKRVETEVHQIVGSKAVHLIEPAIIINTGINKYSEDLGLLTIIEEEGVLLPSLQGGRILDYVVKDFAEKD